MAMTMMMVMFGLIGIGVIGAILIVLHHLLARKDKQMVMDAIKTTVIPELEKMTMDMMEKSMDIIPDKIGDMTKKMLQVQKELEEEMYD